MRVLVTGRGTSGSWAIRGAQLGAAIGADVQPNASKVNGADLGIIVKRGPADLLHRLRGLPLVYDVLDGYPQPSGNEWDKPTCLNWLRRQVETIKPVALVAATQAMAADCAEFGLPVLALPHHARPGQKINPIRERVQTVGYEGGEQYLGSWRGFLEAECRLRGWRFVINPKSLADLDIVVAMREATGYAPRSWKSNVKLANAQGSKTPCVVNREAGYMETKTGGELFADTRKEMVEALDMLDDQDIRRTVVTRLSAPMLDDVAETYKTWLALRFSFRLCRQRRRWQCSMP